MLRAALALADLGGIESLTMRKLGQELGVEAMSLYNHVANKDDILDGIVDLVFGEIDTARRRGGLEDGHAPARRSRPATPCCATPGRPSLMQSRTTPGPATLRHHDAVLRSLREAGFTLVMAAHAFSVMDSYIYGFALQQMNLTYDRSDQAGDVAETFLGSIPGPNIRTWPR